MKTLDAATRRLENAIGRCVAADAEAVTATLHLLALRARSVAPAAVAVALSWSDQGDFLDVMGLLDATGNPIDWIDDEALAWNLGGHLESQWLSYMEADDRDPARASFRLPIQATLDQVENQG